MNKVVLIGRLTKDPELRYTSSNIAVTSFTLAIDRTFSNQTGERETDFINVVVWRKQAENVKNYLSKGSQAAVLGRIQSRSYDAEDGTKRYITEVVADNVEFLGSKGSGSVSNNNEERRQAEPTPYDFKDENIKTTDVDSNPFAEFGSSVEINDSELPF